MLHPVKIFPVFVLVVGCATSSPTPTASPVPESQICQLRKSHTILVHGGVGYRASEPQRELIEKSTAEAHRRLANGDTALNSVQVAIEIMEDSGLFNAGRAGTRTSKNTVELDASIMEGKTLQAGAVASVKDVKNPIRLARAVMEKTPHVLLVGEGASKFAEELGHEIVQPDYFVSGNFEKHDDHFGTVGAVALDRCGNLAAGTSTGGLYGKKPGRVGDSPIIGAGTYANNETVAVSGTGEGEKFIRSSAAARVSFILQYTNRSLKSAVNESLQNVVNLKGSGGLIAIDKKGNPVWATSGKEPMPIGYAQQNGEVKFKN